MRHALLPNGWRQRGPAVMNGQEEGEEGEEEEEVHCQEGKQVQELAQVAGLLCVLTGMILLNFTSKSRKAQQRKTESGGLCLRARSVLEETPEYQIRGWLSSQAH